MKWIKIEQYKTTVPQFEPILIYRKEGYQEVLVWDGEYWNAFDGSYFSQTIDPDNGNITHWMPLPDPPLEENPDI